MKNGFIVDKDGSKYWFKNGLLHREDGSAIERINGDKQWYKNGLLHREDGPAIEWYNGNKFWYKNDLLHREDGPAIEWYDGDKEWYYYGKEMKCKTNEEFLRLIRLKIFW